MAAFESKQETKIHSGGLKSCVKIAEQLIGCDSDCNNNFLTLTRIKSMFFINLNVISKPLFCLIYSPP